MVASVVLNGARSSTRVSAATRARVQEAAAQLGYRRNALAFGLTRSRIDTLGVVATVVGEDINLYFLELLSGILSAAVERGQSTKVFSLADWKQDAGRIPGFCDGRVDGIILIAPSLPDDVALALPAHTPFVAIHCDRPLAGIPNIGIDDEGAAYRITSDLLTRGHRRILHFSGDADIASAAQRLKGYRRALADAGIPWDPSLVLPGGYYIGSGRESMLRVLREFPGQAMPSAVFCASDAIAYGTMEVLAEQGVRVPDQISVVGFDDVLLARTTRPPLTTVRQPFRAMGRRAVEILLARIAHGDDHTADAEEDSRAELFPVEIVERESVGPPRSDG